MRIIFNCTLPRGACGEKEPHIKNAKFRLKTGSVLTIEPSHTEYEMTENTLEMEWCECRLLEIDGIWIFGGDSRELGVEVADLLKDAEFVEFRIDDEAPEDYFVSVAYWGCIDLLI